MVRKGWCGRFEERFSFGGSLPCTQEVPATLNFCWFSSPRSAPHLGGGLGQESEGQRDHCCPPPQGPLPSLPGGRPVGPQRAGWGRGWRPPPAAAWFIPAAFLGPGSPRRLGGPSTSPQGPHPSPSPGAVAEDTWAPGAPGLDSPPQLARGQAWERGTCIEGSVGSGRCLAPRGTGRRLWHRVPPSAPTAVGGGRGDGPSAQCLQSWGTS